MILIQSTADDLSTNNVLDWLFYYKRKNIFRLNGLTAVNSVVLDDSIRLSLDNEINEIELGKDDTFWYRRGGFHTKTHSSISNITDAGNLLYRFKSEVNHIYDNWNAGGISNYLGNPIDNRINKLQMLTEALRSGLKIPKSIFTGSPEKLDQFIQSCPDKVITKAIDTDIFPVFNNEVVSCALTLGTTIITGGVIRSIHSKSGSLPAFFQEYIQKKIEIRIFFLRGICYSMAIFSQANEKTKIDFRNYDRERPNRVIPFQLPGGIEKKVKRFMKKMNLQTGSIDMILSKEGDYVFLEVNPIGQYHWLEVNCNYNISEKIAKEIS